MSKHTLTRTQKLVVTTGRLLSKFSFVAATLGGYVVLTLMMYLWLAIDLSKWGGDAAVIAYDVAFGGSPLPYATVLSQFPFLWKALEIFHVFAWLIIPVLAATMVDAAYRMFEEDRQRKERELRRSIKRWAKSQGMSVEEANEFAEEAMDTFPLGLKKKGRNGTNEKI